MGARGVQNVGIGPVLAGLWPWAGGPNSSCRELFGCVARGHDFAGMVLVFAVRALYGRLSPCYFVYGYIHYLLVV